MPRQTGSKNKPKNARQLLDAVITEYKKQGKSLTIDIKDIADLTDEQRTAATEALSSNPDINIPLEFELETDEGDEGDEKLICGNCRAELDGEDSTCPHCGSNLTWASEDEDS